MKTNETLPELVARLKREGKKILDLNLKKEWYGMIESGLGEKIA